MEIPIFNHFKLLGGFTDASQILQFLKEPTDRQEKKMVAEAYQLIDAGWSRRMEWLKKRIADGEVIDIAAEKVNFYPKEVGIYVNIPLQYVQDYIVKKIGAIQNNTSIHDTKEVADIREIFEEYKINVYPQLHFVFDHVNWSAKQDQKPKILVHAKNDLEDDVCIRFEASGELGQKFLHALLALNLRPGQPFDLTVESVDPAIAKNAKAGKKVADLGVYVNHNLLLTVGGKSHTGHPPKGQKFNQKPTIEQMETLFKQAQFAVEKK